MKRTRGNPQIVAVCIGLVALVGAVFGGTRNYDFVNYDDDTYVYENTSVAEGLSLTSLRSAFLKSDLYLWTPLTRISHLLDAAVFGLNAGKHHLTNVLLHASSTLLLFFALRCLSKRLWPSAFVAAVFAIHPLHVESVAWISERKDVLSGFFFASALWSYCRYASQRSPLYYFLTTVLLALGLLAKPMLVTVPFLFLLLDYWPLKRAQALSDCFRLIPEKLPLFLLAAMAIAIAVFDPFSWNAERPPFSPHPFGARIANAVVSYTTYIAQTFYPFNLTVRYPFPKSIVVWEVVLSALVILAISGWAFFERQRRPYVIVGWLWYVGMLVPVIGILEMGGEGHADRYTYLPQIGLCILIAWSVAEIKISSLCNTLIMSAAAIAILAALAWCAHVQVGYWRNSEALWKHALSVNPDNYLAHNNLGKSLLEKGEVDDAIQHFEQAIQSEPNDALALSNLGVAKAAKKRPEEGLKYAAKAVDLSPSSFVVQNNLGFVLLQLGETRQAVSHCEEALRIKPAFASAHSNLGSALLAEGLTGDALIHFREAARLKPFSSASWNNLAWILATCRDERFRNGGEALALARKAAAQPEKGSEANTLDTLAAALAETGQFSEAIQTASRARDFAQSAGDTALAARISERLKVYAEGRPYRN